MTDASKTMTEDGKLKSEHRYVMYQAKKTFKHVDSILKKMVDAENSELLGASLQEVHQKRKNFLDLKYDLLGILDKPDKNFSKKEEDILQSLLVSFTGKILTYQDQMKSPASRQCILNSIFSTGSIGNTSAPTSHLPTIEIPTFGDIRKFSDFVHLFKYLVHDNHELTKVQELYYLWNSLTGVAVLITDGIELIEAVYDEAWANP